MERKTERERRVRSRRYRFRLTCARLPGNKPESQAAAAAATAAARRDWAATSGGDDETDGEEENGPTSSAQSPSQRLVQLCKPVDGSVLASLLFYSFKSVSETCALSFSRIFSAAVKRRRNCDADGGARSSANLLCVDSKLNH